MNSNFLDLDQIKKNCAYFSAFHPKAIDILRNADGKLNYKEIASKLQVHPTKVSGVLKLALKLGLAKGKNGIYKKVAGVLQHMPSSKDYTLPTLGNALQKIERKRIRVIDAGNLLGIKLSPNLEKMGEAYVWLYFTENTLRDLIRKVFSQEQNWWDQRVNQGIRGDVEKLKVMYPYHGPKRMDNLEYTNLGHLKEIITAKINWSLFAPLLHEQDKSRFIHFFDMALPYRNSIAHSTLLSQEEVATAKTRFLDILKTIK